MLRLTELVEVIHDCITEQVSLPNPGSTTRKHNYTFLKHKFWFKWVPEPIPTCIHKNTHLINKLYPKQIITGPFWIGSGSG